MLDDLKGFIWIASAVLVAIGIGVAAVAGSSTDYPIGYPSRDGFLPAPAGLATRLVFRTTTVGRSPAQVRAQVSPSIPGALIVTNSTGRTIDLARYDCAPAFTAELTNRVVALDASYLVPDPSSCGHPFLLRPGENRFSISLNTISMKGCLSYVPAPSCGRAFPAGHYEAFLVGWALALPPPDPVPFSLVNR